MDVYVFPYEDLLVRVMKVKLSLSFVRQHTVKAYGTAEIQLHASLTSVLDGDL
jgi:hypothetical protein